MIKARQSVRKILSLLFLLPFTPREGVQREVVERGSPCQHAKCHCHIAACAGREE